MPSVGSSGGAPPDSSLRKSPARSASSAMLGARRNSAISLAILRETSVKAATALIDLVPEVGIGAENFFDDIEQVFGLQTQRQGVLALLLWLVEDGDDRECRRGDNLHDAIVHQQGDGPRQSARRNSRPGQMIEEIEEFMLHIAERQIDGRRAERVRGHWGVRVGLQHFVNQPAFPEPGEPGEANDPLLAFGKRIPDGRDAGFQGRVFEIFSLGQNLSAPRFQGVVVDPSEVLGDFANEADRRWGSGSPNRRSGCIRKRLVTSRAT